MTDTSEFFKTTIVPFAENENGEIVKCGDIGRLEYKILYRNIILKHEKKVEGELIFAQIDFGKPLNALNKIELFCTNYYGHQANFTLGDIHFIDFNKPDNIKEMLNKPIKFKAYRLIGWRRED